MLYKYWSTYGQYGSEERPKIYPHDSGRPGLVCNVPILPLSPVLLESGLISFQYLFGSLINSFIHGLFVKCIRPLLCVRPLLDFRESVILSLLVSHPLFPRTTRLSVLPWTKFKWLQTVARGSEHWSFNKAYSLAFWYYASHLKFLYISSVHFSNGEKIKRLFCTEL